MVWLVLGILIWSGVHFVPMAARPLRSASVARIGEGPYKGLFALSLIGAIALMVTGWGQAAAAPVYSPPAWGRAALTPLMLAAFTLFAASAVPTNLKRVLRHPQLTGFGLWAGAHLLANGDRRSLVLFGGLGCWAVVSMLLLNRRDGAWQKPEPLPWSAELKPVIGGIVAFAVLFFAHTWLFGVSPAPT
jgi:uncharacterized membrane protein